MLAANGREKRRRRLRLAGCGETALSMHKHNNDVRKSLSYVIIVPQSGIEPESNL